MRIEGEILGLCHSASVPVPQVFYVFVDSDGVGEGFVMQWLEGETLGSRIARMPQARMPQPLAYQCGQLLGRIHSVSLAGTEAARTLPKTDVRSSVVRYRDMYRSLTAGDRPQLDYCFAWLLENAPPPTGQEVLIHGDFRNGNLMVTEEAGVVAVLDWELAHIGDPMEDLGWLCVNSWRFQQSGRPVGGFGSYDELFRGYER
jgi:aminoglycoside phosphotransferase (APT) family kinase protein